MVILVKSLNNVSVFELEGKKLDHASFSHYAIKHSTFNQGILKGEVSLYH